MKKITRKITLIIVLFGAFQLYGQYETSQKGTPFEFGASYVGDAYTNMFGGLKTGGGFMGMGNITVGFNTEKAGLWKGGSFFINGASIHGKSLSENYLGDLQVASNIDAGNHTYLHELWFKQEFGKFTFTIGLQDLNADFVTTENGGEFLNSSFGIPSVMAINVPVPIFPLTGLGFSAQWNINNQFTWQATLFDGCQKPFEHNPYNLNWGFSKDDGMFATTELHAKFNLMNKEGTYKVGAYYHSQWNEWNDVTSEMETVFKNNSGLYLIADQTVLSGKSRDIGLFTQVSIAPKKNNYPNYYVGMGVNCLGMFSRNKRDALGFAVAHTGLHEESHKHETALELYYKYQINEHIAIQPDLQYIIHPSGTEGKLSNALAGIFRLHVNL